MLLRASLAFDLHSSGSVGFMIIGIHIYIVLAVLPIFKIWNIIINRRIL